MSQASFGQSLPDSVIGVGVDIIRTGRFEEIAQRAPGGVAARLFTPDELSDRRANDREYLASRFAAKEAVMKSLGCGMSEISFTDIEVYHTDGGAPAVRLSGAASRRAGEVGALNVLVSVSHDRDYVCAFAVALGRARGEGAGGEPERGLERGPERGPEARAGVALMELATPDEMRQIDRTAAESYGVLGLALMENAGAAVARVAFRVAARATRTGLCCRGGPAHSVSVCIVAGRGNNGGDGFAAARHLAGFGARVSVYIVGDPSAIQGDARANLDAMVRSGIAVVPLLGEGAWNAARADLAASDVIIDALLGTGARGAPSPEAARAISLMNESPAPIVAVDVPSGVDALTGAVPGECVIAHATVTLALAKTGLMTYPGASYAGRVVLDGIGMPPALIESSRIKAHLTTPDDVREALPVRRPDAHKGDLGRVLIVAGSPGMSGAPSLAAMAALRSGAGLVHLSVPAVIAGEVSARHAEVMTHSAPEGDLSGLLEMTSTCQAVVVGPGMSCCERTSAIVDAMIAELSAPMVLDADAVNVLAGRAQVLREARAPVVLTPHPGELGRLLGVGADEINRDRLGWARRAALETGATVVLKGARTVIADKTGEAYVNPTGNSGMATAGMGDVLAGVAGSLCAAGLSGLAAGYCSAYIHGLAGDFAARDSGLDGMVAGDVLAHIPESFEAARTKTAMLWAMMPIAYAHMPEGW